MSCRSQTTILRLWTILLWGVWLIVPAWAQEEDPHGPLAEARELALENRHAEAIELYRRLVTEVEQQDGPEAAALILLSYEMAVQHHMQGALGEAETLYQRSLTLAESHRGRQHPALVPSLRGLATVSATLGRLQDASALYQRALNIQEAESGKPADIAKTLAELGLISQLQKQYDQAEGYYQRALQIGMTNPLDEMELAIISGNLGALYDRQKRYADAEPQFRRALAIREKLMGADHPDLARFHQKLGSLQYRQERFAEAAASYERSLKILEESGPEDLTIADVLGRLAASYRRLGRSTAADAHFGMAFAILSAQCEGREGTRACRDAIWNHRDLRDERLPPPTESTSRPVAVAIAEPVAPAPPAPPPPPPPPRVEPQRPAPPPPSPPAPPTPEPDVAAEAQVAQEEVAPPKPPPLTVKPQATRGVRVHRAQVGARQEASEASDLLKQMQESYPQLLNDQVTRVVRVDLGERGVWHRIQIGEFGRVAPAKAFCSELVRLGHDGCWVVTTED